MDISINFQFLQKKMFNTRNICQRLISIFIPILYLNCFPLIKQTEIQYYSIPNDHFTNSKLLYEDTYCAFLFPLSATNMKSEILLFLYNKYSKLNLSNKIIIRRNNEFEWFCNHNYKIEIYENN
jgi:hypothetical protein